MKLIKNPFSWLERTTSIAHSQIMKLINNLFTYQNLTKDTSYLIYFLLMLIVLAYVIPTIIFQSPFGTDVYTHMYNTLRMENSNSLFEFYEKFFQEEDLFYDYPFGLWFFGSIVTKVTGMNIHELVYVLTLALSIISIPVYYTYAYRLLQSRNSAILASIFLISMPLLSISMLNYSTSRFVTVILIVAIYISINKPNLSSIFIAGMLVFSLVFTHTGTYMFLMFFSMAYFIFFALLWKRFDAGMYILIVSLLFFYIMAVQLFPYVQPQYIDKGRMVISISESISSKLGLEFIKEIGRIFYDKIFVANNLIYVIFWSSLIFAAGKFSLFINSKFEASYYKNILAIPVIGSIQNVSHGIITAPFWLGPVHTLLSVFGILKLDAKGKCIALSLVLSALLPGAMGSAEGTGALREIYYLFLIIPVSAAAGFYYVISKIKKYSINKIKKVFIAVFILLLLLPLISMPIIGNLYYMPTISGTKNEKENLIWLSKIGNSREGVPDFAYRERIDLYANKLTPSIPSGSEMKRYLNDLKSTYFTEGAEQYAKDLYSFNIKYIISSERTLKGFGERKDSLRIDSNKQLDKIFSSDKDFDIYRYITSPAIPKNSSSEEFTLKFAENTPNIQDFGSAYLVENDFYKVKLSESSPEIIYIGTKTKNMLGEGGFSDYITISWRGAYKEKYVGYNLNELRYPDIFIKDNKIIYKTVVRDQNNQENWATLIVKYTFYEKAVKREIIIANDWVSSESDLEMNLAYSSSIFAPVTDFEFNQLGYGEEKARSKKIYPSQDAVILKDKKFNEIYFNESGTGLFIKYSDLTPYPTRMSYQGSTIYEYGGISMDSSFSLSPSESITLTQYFSVGDKLTAKNNIEPYTSVSPYMYPEAKIPVILTGYIEEYGLMGYYKDAMEYSSNTYKKFQNYSITYNEGITPRNKYLLGKKVNPMGYVNLYEKQTYKNLSDQSEDIKNIKTLNVSGILPKYFKYNLNTIKALSDNNLMYAEALTVPSPFMEFFREGLRHPKTAYYHGEETGVVLIPVTTPSSSILRPEYDTEDAFSQWKETLDSVIEDGGVGVFLWNARDIGNPEYIDKIMELINYSKNKGMNFTTPDEIALHFKLIQKVSANATKGTDFVILNATNHNHEEVKGVTYRLYLPVLNNSCPYYAVNARIPKVEIKEGTCRVYVSFDLKADEQKEIKIEPDITRKSLELDFSDVYEGKSIIKVRDEEGNPVDEAGVYVDAQRFVSDNKGEVELTIRRGMHKIKAEKPGFVSRDYEIEVKGRIYRLLGYVK